ncbi:MAG: aquaporin family protein [Firmicutes bacterium]|nr:aquaporin family protein [Bacillota bacterium]
MDIIKRSSAEAVASFILIFFGVGTAIITSFNPVATAIAFGTAFAVAFYMFGGISGCHANPAISLAKLILRKIDVRHFVFYILAQIIGSLLGAIALFAIFRTVGQTPPVLGTSDLVFGIATWQSYLVTVVFETIVSALLVFVFLHTVPNETKQKSALIIGITIALVYLFPVGITGGGANPVRSLAPAIASAIFRHSYLPVIRVWVFVVAPLAGSAIGAMGHMIISKPTSISNNNTNTIPAKSKK